MDDRIDVAALQDRVDRLLDEVRLALLDDEDVALANTEGGDLVVDERIGNVQHMDRHSRRAVDVGDTEKLERPECGVVHAALHDDAAVVEIARKGLVQTVLGDEADGGGPPLLDLLLLMDVGRRRQHDAADVADRILHRLLERKGGTAVVARREAPVDMAGADAQFQHDGGVRGFRQCETRLDGADDGGQVRARVEKPDLRLHRECVAALLHDRGALAVVLADDDQRTPGHPAGGEIGERVGGDVGADRRLEGHRAAQGVIDGGGESGGGGRLAGARFEMHSEVGENVVGIGQNVHQMRDGRTLVTGDVGDAGLEERLGDCEDALAAEDVALAEMKFPNLFLEGAFRHRPLPGHVATSASTRSGLPEPRSILRGGAMRSAPVAGS